MTKPIALVLAFAACKSEPPSAAPTPVAPLPDAPSATDQAEKMRHCPVTVPGVTAALADVDGGVQFTLRGKAPEAVTEARARAHRLVEFTAGRNAAGGAHGGGRGGGFMRNCPIVTKDSRVVAKDVPDGVDITVTPLDATQLVAFRATARERFDRAPLERAKVVLEERSDQGETKLFSGRAEDLDGDGTLELVAGGFSTVAGGKRPTLRVYRQAGATWTPIADAGWDTSNGSTIRNVEIGDLDGDERPEVIALGRVGTTSENDAKARLAVLGLAGGKLVERAVVDWGAGTYTHGYGLAVGDLDGDRTLEIVSAGFQLEGTQERGFVRVWSLRDGKLVLRAETTLDGQGSASMRINDVAIGDVDGDGKADIVVAGRRGALKTQASKDLAQRHETGDLSVLAFAGDRLKTRTRFAWTKGTSIRLRSVVLSGRDIIAGGQYDADGKAALGLFGFVRGKLVLRDDASSNAEGVTGEIKDLVLADQRVLATGVIGDKPGRHGEVGAWRVVGQKLVRETNLVSRNGDETRARAVVVIPGKAGSTVLTIGHAKNATTMVGQVLAWPLANRPSR